MTRTGVYQIRNIVNGRLYIGSAAGTRGLHGRWKVHQRQLISNSHKNKHLQRAWNKHQDASFVFEILEECLPERCVEREQYYLDTVLFANCSDSRFHKLGYNICRVAGNTLGVTYPDEARAKISSSLIGNQRMLGCNMSDATKVKISKAMQNQKNFLHHRHTKETKTKMMNNRNSAKLTQKEVNEILDLLCQGLTQAYIAQQFGISRCTVSNIKTGKTWTNSSK